LQAQTQILLQKTYFIAKKVLEDIIFLNIISGFDILPSRKNGGVVNTANNESTESIALSLRVIRFAQDKLREAIYI